MLNAKQLMDYMKENQGEILNYGEKFVIQVYNGPVLEACISVVGESPFLKIEPSKSKSISVFLEKTTEKGIIDYTNGCDLLESDSVMNLFNIFSEHPRIEQALIALLELH